MDWDLVLSVLSEAAAAAVERARPLMGEAGAAVLGRTPGGDIETAADQAALEAIETVLRRAPLRIALLDEAHGAFREMKPNPEVLVVADELDGTRPHALGLPTCTASLAALPAGDEPTLGNVRCGVLHSFEGRTFSFIKGAGVRVNGQPFAVPAREVGLEHARLFYEGMRGGSFGLLGLMLMPFDPQVRQGVLCIASSTYSAIKLVEGSAHGHFHIGHRLWESWPSLQERMSARGGGGGPGQHGYDVAAAVPLLWEAGRVVTDGYGRPLEGRRLDDERPFSQIAAVNAGLHREILDRLERQERWMKGRADWIERLLTEGMSAT